MSLRPNRGRILIRRDAAESVTSGGILVPDTAKEAPLGGVVVAVGGDAVDERGKAHPIGVSVGERVIVHVWAGSELEIDGVPHLVIREQDIVGVEA